MTSNGQKILLVIGACVAAMLAAEGALRLSGKALEASFFIADRELGWSLRPGAEGWSLRERPVYVRINRDGMRDRDHDVAKPPGRLRIAILGDSYAEAMSVDLHQTFWAELERRVARCRPDGAPLEVLNFGVSGYGTGQQLLQLRRIWKYAPDIVVLAFYPGNDVANNHPGLAPSMDREFRPRFRLASGALVLDESYRQSASLQPRAIRNQRLRVELQERVRLLQLVRQVTNDLRRRAAREAREIFEMERQLLAPPTEPALIEAWRVTESLIAEMHRETRARGTEFWVGVVPMRAQVHPDPGFRSALAARLDVPELHYAERRIAALAEAQTVSTMALSRHLAASTLGQGTYVNGGGTVARGDGHWNELGHRLAGEHMADQLCAKSERLGRRALAAAAPAAEASPSRTGHPSH